MRRLTNAVVLALVAAFAAGAASAAETPGRWEGGVYAGAGRLGALNLRTQRAQLPDIIALGSDTGWSVTAAAGYRVGETVRITLDFDRAAHDLSGSFIRAIQPRIACLVNGVSGRCPDPGARGRLTAAAILAGISADIALSPRWAVAAGASLGATIVDARLTSEPATVLPTPVRLLDTGDTVFTGAGTLELVYHLTPRVRLGAGYRYLRAGRLALDASFGPAPFGAERALSSHGLRVGVRRSF